MEFKRQRVLVINSCSKSKQISLPNQPHCPELETENQRKAEIMKFKDSLISAADLYTGQQALAIARSVKILKEF